METRLTLRPGQNGTKKLLERYGERLVRVRYLYDARTGRRLKTVELIIESVPWSPRTRHPRRRDDEIVPVRIAFEESELRARAMRLGAVWRPAQKLWEISWRNAKNHRPTRTNGQISLIYQQIYAGIAAHIPMYVLHPQIDISTIASMSTKQ